MACSERPGRGLLTAAAEARRPTSALVQEARARTATPTTALPGVELLHVARHTVGTRGCSPCRLAGERELGFDHRCHAGYGRDLHGDLPREFGQLRRWRWLRMDR